VVAPEPVAQVKATAEDLFPAMVVRETQPVSAVSLSTSAAVAVVERTVGGTTQPVKITRLALPELAALAAVELVQPFSTTGLGRSRVMASQIPAVAAVVLVATETPGLTVVMVALES
jgi:hypothetical protein